MPWFIALVLALVVLLAWQYPDAIGGGRQMRVIYLLALLMLVGSGLYLQPRGLNRSKVLKYGLIWVAIFAGIALFYMLMESRAQG